MPPMHSGRTYPGGNAADPRSGITLKVSEPLSPNAFVQIPAEPPLSQESAVYTPTSRPKKMRVPHGGSVERQRQRPQRAPAPSAPLKEPAPETVTSPSLHIFLEGDLEDEGSSTREEDQSESLAQFAALFPKIPNKLIFQSSDEDDEGAAKEAQEELPNDDFDEDAEPFTLRLDEGQWPEDDLSALSGDTPAQAQRTSHAQRHGATPASERMKPVNPRFEKMIRDATSQRTAPIPQAISADLPNTAFGRGMGPRQMSAARRRGQAISGSLPAATPQSASGARTMGGAMAAAGAARQGFGQDSLRGSGVSGPLPRRSAVQSSPLSARPSRFPGSPSADLPTPARPWPSPGMAERRQGALSGVPGQATRPLRPAASAAVPSPAVMPSTPGAPAAMATPSHEPAASVLGKPLLDASAIEESAIFKEAPISIAEGMKDADKSRKKGRKFALIGAVVVVVAAIGAFFFFGNQGTITIPEITITTTDPHGKDSGGSSDANDSTKGSDGGGQAESVSGGEPVATGAGSVTYQYTAKTPGGIEYDVEESTTFDAQGNCTFTTMQMKFPSESAAKDYTDTLARDLGSKYTLDNLDGANATITIDNSALGLNREDYENALRYSVDDLVILKK